MKKIKLILFDIDNTLIYGEDARRYYRQYGPLLEKVLGDVMAVPLEKAKEVANEHRRLFSGRGEKAFEPYDPNMSKWNEAICTLDPFSYIKPITETQKLLEYLKSQGYMLGAITDGPTKQASKILRAAGVDERLFSLLIGWELGEKMPKGGLRDVYERIISQYRLQASEIFMVGDSMEVDIVPAHACGINVLHINATPSSVFPTIPSIKKLADYIKKYETNKK